VVVVGGGTAGAAAGIGAARQGAKTLVVEYLHGLGGVGTLGMIGKYWHGNRVGFTATVPENPTEVRMEFLRSELRKAGADIWFGSMGCGALVEGNRVTGAVVVTPYGRGVVLAKTVIDGTGNADVASAAGAETQFVEDHFALQASHIPPREVGAFYINGNLAAVDAADPLDVREAMQHRKERYFDRGQIVDSRERQRIVGDYCLDWLDQINRRTFPDSIALAESDYDSHGYQVHPYFMLKPARPPGDSARKFWSHLPYRCLLPRGVEGMLVIGLGLSAHRDAMPIVRMQPDLQNSGYAAGVASAMAVKAGITPRQVNVKALQQHLVEIGNLDKSVLSDRDSFPMPKAEVAAAVQRVASNYDGLEVVLAQPQDSLPLLQAAYDSASGANKLAYAHVLGVMSDGRGVETLVAEAQRRLKAKDFPKPVGKKVGKGKGRIEMSMDDTARLIWALGSAGDRRVVASLCALAEASSGMEFATSTRFRAIAVSLGRLGDPSAAPTLAAMVKAKAGKDEMGELIAACALFRCGDRDGLARATLERFVGGSNGPYSRLAWQVLNSKRSP
ncbi:MAG: FAD-dependent oxidoreductase, partial [Verrucomicrobia bacterium]|nr:FAD-dependent oxidoreductase [Verrucomicrobiota bacterium]